MVSKKKYIIGCLGFLLVFILQTTVLKHIAILGWSPNVLLCLVAVCSFLYEEKIGLVYGIIFGLLLDLVTGPFIGPSAIAFTLVYLIALALRTVFSYERIIPELLLAGISTPLYSFSVWLLSTLAGHPISIILVLRSLPVLLIYNGIIIILLHLLLVRTATRNKKDTKIKDKFIYRGGFNS